MLPQKRFTMIRYRLPGRSIIVKPQFSGLVEYWVVKRCHESIGLLLPFICTPEELLGEENE